MKAIVKHRYAKMNGSGNEIVVVDMRNSEHSPGPTDARVIAAAVGRPYDQLMILQKPRLAGTEAFIRIYNVDGSEAGACGNGTRCVARFVFQATGQTRATFETISGLLACWRGPRPDLITVNMGKPRFAWQEIPLAVKVHNTRRIDLHIDQANGPLLYAPSAVSMGNPHAIFWVEDVNDYDLACFGPLLETHPMFPERANITLARIVDREHITIRTWERGAGLTRACGSAACATAVAAARLERTNRVVNIALPGDTLDIEWRERANDVLMSGTATSEYEGTLDSTAFRDAAIDNNI